MRSAVLNSMMVLILLSGALEGCGRLGSPVSKEVQPLRNDPIPGKGQIKVDLEKTRAAAKSGNLTCPFDGECEPSVAMISVVSPEGLDRCSGVLISEDEVLTNDHCVNQGVFMEGLENSANSIPCKDDLFVHFSEIGGTPADHVGCAEIRVRSRETGLQSLDYAIIKLDRKISGRKPLDRSERMLQDREQIKIYRVQMDGAKSGKYDGAQAILECRVSYSTFLYPGVNSPSSPLMTFGDCAIQSGNSGSPVLNSEGKLSAIIQGYLSLKEESDLHKEVEASLLDDSFGQVGVGTQAPCIEGLVNSDRSLCGSIPEIQSQSPNEFLTHSARWNPSALLPDPASGSQWMEISQSDASLRKFLMAPRCGGMEKFMSLEKDFKVGFNRFFQAEWREKSSDGVLNKEFRMNSDQAGERIAYQSNDGIRLEIDACRSVASK